MAIEGLQNDEVHIWTVNPWGITDPALLAAYDAVMTEEERTKQRRFVFEEGRRECLVARALVRSTLSKYANVEPHAWRFVAGERGKPSLVPGQTSLPLSFNLSHTHNLIACAVTLDREVGVDVEWKERKGETVAIADRFFAPVEYSALQALPTLEAKRERFFRYWTLKEAYIKARGQGLHLPLEQFWFYVEESPIRIGFDPRLHDDPRSWQFGEYDVGPAHAMSLAVRNQGTPMRVRVRPTIPLTPA